MEFSSAKNMFVLALLMIGLGFTSARKSMREIQLEAELEELEQPPSDSFRLADPPAVYPGRVSLPIDYSGGHTGNFTNRYFVVDEYYKPGGPIFVLDTGESNGADRYTTYFTRNDRFINAYLRAFNGLGIVWEHRYYGESLPFPVTLDTPAEQMRFLTTENALKDFDVFANQFTWKDHPVSPKLGPWVVIGGSYPGMRAAMLRNLYPKTVFAAYASSAPIQAQRDMSIYWEQAYRGMVRYNLANCTSRIKLAVDYMDSQLAYPEASARLKKKFLGVGADKNSNAGFADTLLFPFYNWQAQGVNADIRSLCDHMHVDAEKANAFDGTREQGRWFADRWASWGRMAELVNENMYTNCSGPEWAGPPKGPCDLDGRFQGVLSISWTWQYCTEWGFLQTTNFGPNELGSKYNDLKHQQELCHRQFPDGLSSGHLPKVPKTAYVNKVSGGGWYIRPSNTFWTGGEFDPWRTLSPLSTEKFAPEFALSEAVPKCGESRSALFGYLMPEAEHCYDFKASSLYLKSGVPQGMFANALREWLKCWGK